MKVIGIVETVETVETGELQQTEPDCIDYGRGYDFMRRLLPDGVRLLSVRVERQATQQTEAIGRFREPHGCPVASLAPAGSEIILTLQAEM